MKKRILILLTALFFCSGFVNGQNEKFKALFMYNFTKNIAWPASYSKGNFVIGILGNSPMTKELKIIAQTKKTGNQPIVVKTYSSISGIGRCHILYIPPAKSANLNQVLKKTSKQSTLIITDKQGLAQEGSCINYVMDGNKIRFEINRNNIEKRKMQVSNSLVNLGIAVQ